MKRHSKGMMFITLVLVTERTREIGIRLALGVRGADVLIQFLVESIVMGGLVLGITSAKVLTHLTGWETSISPLVMIIAVGFSGAVGVFFGCYPVQKAAALHPIEALRYERSRHRTSASGSLPAPYVTSKTVAAFRS